MQPAVDPAVLAARRQQSDRASAEIGRKLLAGWTLLEDTCDSASCFGVPLMRRPSPSRTRAQKEGESNRTTDVGALPKNLVDPRRHCVSCGQEYLRESDIKLYEDYLAATQPSSSQPVASTSALPTVTRSAAASRDEDEEADEVIQHSSAAKKRRFSTQPGVSSTGKAKVVGSAGTARSRLVPQVSRDFPVQWLVRFLDVGHQHMFLSKAARLPCHLTAFVETSQRCCQLVGIARCRPSARRNDGALERRHATIVFSRVHVVARYDSHCSARNCCRHAVSAPQ